MDNPQILENFRRKLAQSGLKLTSQRKLIFIALLENGALTTPEVAILVSDKVDRATVYRVLDKFEEIGLITRIWDGWKSKLELSDVFIAHHHHATCSKCAKGIRIESSELEKVLNSISQDVDLKMTSHTVELYGLCKDCS